MAGLYVHIPWCKQVCYYCDFHFRVSMDDKNRVLAAIRKEMSLRSDYLPSNSLSTLYFGGGTPSVLMPPEWSGLFEAIGTHYLLEPDAEITAEVNPDDLDFDYLVMLRSLGINRLSIGIQSFSDPVLKWMNRRHTAKEAEESVWRAREAGFENISIDLIYAIPDMSVSLWNTQIEKAMRLPIDHLSAYALSIEPATPFGVFQRKGKLQPAPESLASQHFLHLMKRLPEWGFAWYEIANFSLPGFVSRHNSSYWNQENYLGLGPSAHSFDGVSRQWNDSVNSRYVAGIEREEGYFEREILSVTDQYHDYILTSLRTRRGVDSDRVGSRFGELFRSHLLREAEPFMKEGLLEGEGSSFRLTPHGMLLADRITRALFF